MRSESRFGLWNGNGTRLSPGRPGKTRARKGRPAGSTKGAILLMHPASASAFEIFAGRVSSRDGPFSRVPGRTWALPSGWE